MKIYIGIIILLLCMLNSEKLQSQPNSQTTIWKFSVGAGLWYKSEQPLMENDFLPLHVSIEHGKQKSKLHLWVDINFTSSFTQFPFRLSSKNLLLDCKYTFFEFPMNQNPKKIAIFGVAGINPFYSVFAQYNYEGISNYENITEKKFGLGFNGGGGISYRIKKIELSLVFLYITGTTEVYAGKLKPQNLGIGSYQANLFVSYILTTKKSNSKDNIICPAYKN